MAVSSAPIAVMMTTGKVGSIRWMSLRTSIPDFPGSIRSRSTTSNQFSSTFLRPSSPDPAVSVVKPSEFSSSSMLSRISSSSSMMRTTPFRLDIHWFPYHRKFQPEGCSNPGLTFDRNTAAMLLYDSITDRKPQTRSLAGGFGCEERVVNFLDVLAADSNASVLHQNLEFGVQGIRQNPQLASFRHRVSCVDEQVQEHLLQFTGITECDRALRAELALNADTRGLELMLEK